MAVLDSPKKKSESDSYNFFIRLLLQMTNANLSAPDSDKLVDGASSLLRTLSSEEDSGYDDADTDGDQPDNTAGTIDALSKLFGGASAASPASPSVSPGVNFVSTDTSSRQSIRAALSNGIGQTLQELDGTQYVFGGKSKDGIDCSGFVARAVSSGLRQTGGTSGVLFTQASFNPSEFFTSSSQGQFSELAKSVGSGALNTAQLQNGIRGGMVIAIDSGKTSFDAGRADGIDHIVTTYEDSAGVTWVAESSGHKGVHRTRADTWLNRARAKNYKLYGVDLVDVIEKSKGMAPQVHEAAPSQSAAAAFSNANNTLTATTQQPDNDDGSKISGFFMRVLFGVLASPQKFSNGDELQKLLNDAAKESGLTSAALNDTKVQERINNIRSTVVSSASSGNTSTHATMFQNAAMHGGLLDLIAMPESGGNYNVAYGNRRPKTNDGRILEQMTVNEVLTWQAHNDSVSSAVGRYQILQGTLKGLASEMHLTGNEIFGHELQDRMALRLAQRRGLDNFLDGKIDSMQFMKNLSFEWAGLPKNLGGKSAYSGDGLNESHANAHATVQGLEAYRISMLSKPEPGTGS